MHESFLLPFYPAFMYSDMNFWAEKYTSPFEKALTPDPHRRFTDFNGILINDCLMLSSFCGAGEKRMIDKFRDCFQMEVAMVHLFDDSLTFGIKGHINGCFGNHRLKKCTTLHKKPSSTEEELTLNQ